MHPISLHCITPPQGKCTGRPSGEGCMRELPTGPVTPTSADVRLAGVVMSPASELIFTRCSLSEEASVRDAFCIPLNRSILLQAYDGEFEDFVDIEFENLNKSPAKRLKVIVRGATQDFGNPNYILPDANHALPDIQSGHNGLINEPLDPIPIFLNSPQEPDIPQHARGTQDILSKDWNGLQLQEMQNDCSPQIGSPSALIEFKMSSRGVKWPRRFTLGDSFKSAVKEVIPVQEERLRKKQKGIILDALMQRVMHYTMTPLPDQYKDVSKSLVEEYPQWIPKGLSSIDAEFRNEAERLFGTDIYSLSLNELPNLLQKVKRAVKPLKDMINGDAPCLELYKLLCSHFKEPPCLVSHSNSLPENHGGVPVIMKCKNWKLVVGGVELDLLESDGLLFYILSSFFIFDIEFPPWNVKTLDTLQRCLFSITVAPVSLPVRRLLVKLE
ncbi:unnamed protein product [Darwinula stevensoni]|uniref:Uncharacterized protein n=1 Tax=Darwinula stevensoni TaxID=69355 RepID=A0A7R8X5U9_9CRUS|nr:unnamed protein product [Darwinula stevensoni]CAG0887456.1 unnamed protein product [Darwinula stevensoni]